MFIGWRSKIIMIMYIVLVCSTSTCLWRTILVGFKSIFMHDPVTLLSIRSPPFVEDKGFSHSNKPALIIHRLVPPRRLPEPGHCRPVCPRPGRILLVLVAEEVPFILLFVSDPTSLYNNMMITLLQKLYQIYNWNPSCNIKRILYMDIIKYVLYLGDPMARFCRDQCLWWHQDRSSEKRLSSSDNSRRAPRPSDETGIREERNWTPSCIVILCGRYY